MKWLLVYLLVVTAFSGCVPTSKKPKYLFSDGQYNMRSGKEKKTAYLNINEDKILVYKKSPTGRYDTSRYSVIIMNDSAGPASRNYTFIKYSFDLDLLSIPLKFRPALSDFPAQLNTTVNGSLFIGHRGDIYKLKRKTNELGTKTSALQHYGFSIGGFFGIGSAVMNPSVTRNAITTEYDAVVIPFGLTALVGYNNLTFGLATGMDHMMNNHRKFWIYRGKLWVGLTVGLNLN